jgi:hypothetical protein
VFPTIGSQISNEQSPIEDCAASKIGKSAKCVVMLSQPGGNATVLIYQGILDKVSKLLAQDVNPL